MEALDLYATIAAVVFVTGMAYQTALRVSWLLRRSRPLRRAKATEEKFVPLGFREALNNALYLPFASFSFKSHPALALGAIGYHIGIIGIVTGYTICAVLLAYRVAAGFPLPPLPGTEAFDYGLTLGRMGLIIFGSGEPTIAAFLFGPYAPIFLSVTWAIEVFAFVGMTMLVVVHLSKLSGAVRRDIDSASKGVRIKGRFSLKHIVVTLIIYGIIWTEILGRLQLVEGIAVAHTVLGLTFLMAVPFSYLSHIIWTPLYVYYAVRRWRQRIAA